FCPATRAASKRTQQSAWRRPPARMDRWNKAAVCRSFLLYFLVAVILSEGGLPPAFSKAGNPSRRILVFKFKFSVPLCLCGDFSRLPDAAELYLAIQPL